MDFLLSDDQKMIAETARKVGERFGLDYWRDLDARKSFPENLAAAGGGSTVGQLFMINPIFAASRSHVLVPKA